MTAPATGNTIVGPLAGHELELLRRDVPALVLLFAVPLAVMSLFRPALELALFAEGYVWENGSGQAVPGVAVTFSLFLMGYVGLSFFRDHGWQTWDRLRALPARPWQIVAAKTLPLLGLAVAQLAVLFGAGFLVLGLESRGSAVALVLLVASLPGFPVAAGMATVALARSLQQLNVVANLGTIVLAGVGGALVPMSLLPGWVQAIAPLSPAYWAMRGFRSVILEGGGVGEVLLPIVVLLAWTIALGLVAVHRFHFDERKLSWS